MLTFTVIYWCLLMFAAIGYVQSVGVGRNARSFPSVVESTGKLSLLGQPFVTLVAKLRRKAHGVMLIPLMLGSHHEYDTDTDRGPGIPVAGCRGHVRNSQMGRRPPGPGCQNAW